MSWIDKIDDFFIVTTGDGKIFGHKFKILYKNPVKVIEYNVAQFEFPNLSGTLVKRERPKGRKFPIELYIQGENHIDEALEFELSANDPRPWELDHPYYGKINVQPIDLTFDHTQINVTKITGTLIETITEGGPKFTLNHVDRIVNDKKELDDKSAKHIADSVKPKAADLFYVSDNIDKLYEKGSKYVKKSLDSEAYFNAFNTASSAVANLTAIPLEAMRQIQAMISAPALFVDSVKNRVNILLEQFNMLRDTIPGLASYAQKKLFENNMAMLVSSVAVAAVTKPNSFSLPSVTTPVLDEDLTDEDLKDIIQEYSNRREVVSMIEQITDTYSQYITDLDTLQDDSGTDPDSFIPDVQLQIALNSLVNYTVSNLFDVAINAKQERTLFCEDDTNVILLAHRFYGLKADDSTIEQLINNNNIGLSEILEIKKHRKIVYYI